MWFLEYLFYKLKPKEKRLKPHYIIEGLRPYCTLFGSRLWGGATNKSDVDLLASTTYLNSIKNVLEDCNISYKTHTAQYNFEIVQLDFIYDGLLYSISLSDYEEHIAQKQAIQLTTCFFEKHPENVNRKWYRKEVFEAMLLVVYKNASKLPKEIEIFFQEEFPELLV